MLNSYQVIISNTALIHSFIQLCKYKLCQYVNQEEKKQADEIRSYSSYGLREVVQYGVIQTFEVLSHSCYAGVLAKATATAGGIVVEADTDIAVTISNIFNFIHILLNGRYPNPCLPTVPPLPALLKESVEQIEVEGAQEEVEAQMTNNENRTMDINYHARNFKAILLNAFINPTNPQNRFH
ncbi:MAG: hypothetical protein EZS28_015506 [Streblomastix strix]|uniref:Uncharacterized protein n=1 Tax=Streblomastix strix TaxID=222440 RepID=A0A5J4W253_9EUKA|nr:MAG: hypothetical protein EZS28_015506 [Streblomastix strix]